MATEIQENHIVNSVTNDDYIDENIKEGEIVQSKKPIGLNIEEKDTVDHKINNNFIQKINVSPLKKSRSKSPDIISKNILHETNNVIERSRSKSPSPKVRSKSPDEHRSRSKSPLRSRSRSPHRSTSKSPLRSRSKSPLRSTSKSPLRSRSKSPELDSSPQSSESTPRNKKTPLFDQPLEMTGKRERKNIDRLAMPDSSSKHSILIPQGSGTKLGACPQVEATILKIKSEDLKLLHRILFGKAGQVLHMKKHIRDFNGFDFEHDSTEFIKKKEILNKTSMAKVKDICVILNLNKSLPKEELVKLILEFLMSPKPSTISSSGKKKKSATKGSHRKILLSSIKKKTDKSSAKRKVSENEDDEITQVEEDLDKTEDESNDGDDTPVLPEKKLTSSKRGKKPTTATTASHQKSRTDKITSQGRPGRKVAQPTPIISKTKKTPGAHKKLLFSDSDPEDNDNTEEKETESEPESHQASSASDATPVNKKKKTIKKQTPAKIQTKAKNKSHATSPSKSSIKNLKNEKVTMTAATAKHDEIVGSPTKKSRREKKKEVEKVNDSVKAKKSPLKAGMVAVNQKKAKVFDENIYSDTEEDVDTIDGIQDENPIVNTASFVKLSPAKMSPNKHSTAVNSEILEDKTQKSPKKNKPSDKEMDEEHYPTDEEIKSVVKEIISNSNLMDISIKGVCKLVYNKFSTHNLTSKKDFIKDTIKSLLL